MALGHAHPHGLSELGGLTRRVTRRSVRLARSCEDREVGTRSKAERDQRGEGHRGPVAHELDPPAGSLQRLRWTTSPQCQLGEARLHRDDALPVHAPGGPWRDGSELPLCVLEPAAHEREPRPELPDQDLVDPERARQLHLVDCALALLPAPEDEQQLGRIAEEMRPEQGQEAEAWCDAQGIERERDRVLVATADPEDGDPIRIGPTDVVDVADGVRDPQRCTEVVERGVDLALLASGDCPAVQGMALDLASTRGTGQLHGLFRQRPRLRVAVLEVQDLGESREGASARLWR